MDKIRVTVENHYSSTVPIENFRRLTSEELCAIAAEAGMLLEKTYGMKGVRYYKNLNALARALHKTLELIGVAPPGWKEYTLAEWQNTAPHVAKELPVWNSAKRYPQNIAKDALDWMTNDIAEIFDKKLVSGFGVRRVLSELQYRLADIFLHYLAANVGGISAKEYAASMHRSYETLAEVKKVKELKEISPRPRKKS